MSRAAVGAAPARRRLRRGPGRHRRRSGSRVPLIPPETKPVEDLEPLSRRRAAPLRPRLLHGPRPAGRRLPARRSRRISSRGDRGASAAWSAPCWPSWSPFHAPDDLRIAVCAGAEHAAEWEWVKWLPHALHPHEDRRRRARSGWSTSDLGRAGATARARARRSRAAVRRRGLPPTRRAVPSW